MKVFFLLAVVVMAVSCRERTSIGQADEGAPELVPSETDKRGEVPDLTTSKADLEYVIESVHDVEIEGVPHQLSILRASGKPDSLDLAFRITLENAVGSVFDIAVSKDEFSSYLSETTLLHAGLVKLKFNRRDRHSFLFTTYMGSNGSSSTDKIDFTIDCIEPAKCGIMSWEVNDTLIVQGCWG